MDKGELFDIIFWDFQETFEKFSHKRLLRKLSHYGIPGKTHYNGLEKKQNAKRGNKYFVLSRTWQEHWICALFFVVLVWFSVFLCFSFPFVFLLLVADRINGSSPLMLYERWKNAYIAVKEMQTLKMNLAKVWFLEPNPMMICDGH